MMRARTKRLPGQPGTKRLVKIYGDRLICVRYRYDQEQKRRLKTVELIVDEAPWNPKPTHKAEAIVFVQVARHETELQLKIRQYKGRWDFGKQLWRIQYKYAKALQLLDRIVEPELE